MTDDINGVIDRLTEIQESILDMMDEARTMLRDVEPAVRARAEAYWIPHIESMAGAESGNPYDTSIQTTINELFRGEDV